MNEELNIILTKHMPDGIMLVKHGQNEQKQEAIKLINDEFLRIFDASEMENETSVLDLVK